MTNRNVSLYLITCKIERSHIGLSNAPHYKLPMNTTEQIFLPYHSINPNYIACYYQRETPSNNHQSNPLTNSLPTSNSSGRFLSPSSKKRLKKSCNWLLELATSKKVYHEKYKSHYYMKVNFITLTLPALQSHLDTTIKRECLNLFLANLRKTCKVNNYIWRNEAQENGNIHFHILTDTYINHYLIRTFWNRAIGKLGYLKKYQQKFKGKSFDDYCKIVDPKNNMDKDILLRRWKFGNSSNWLSPNTTDIHSLQNVKNVPAYLVKYLTKEENEKGKDNRYTLKSRKIKGKGWGVSQELSKIRGLKDLRNEKVEKIIDFAVDKLGCKVIVEEWVTVYCVRMEEWKNAFKSFYDGMIEKIIDEFSYIRGGICPINYKLS